MQATTDNPSSAASPLNRGIIIAALFLLGMAFVVLAIQRGLWIAPLRGDQSAHIYLGQLIMRGQRPYVDFVQFQPPLRLLVTWLWSVTANLLNTPIVETARVFCLIAALATMLAIYGSASGLSGSPIAGIVTAAAFVALNITVDSVVIGPNLKLFIMLAAALGLWLAQRGRWIGAGLLLGAATLMWLPAGVYLAAVGLAILLQRDDPPIRPLLRYIAGAAAITLALAILLALTGTLTAALRQSVGGLLQELTRRGGGDGSSAILYFIPSLARTFQSRELFPVLMIAGFIMIVARDPKQAIRQPRMAVPLLAFVAILIALLMDFQGNYDLLPALPALMPFVAVPVIAALNFLRHRIDGIAWIEWAAAVGFVAILLTYGYLRRDFAFDKWDDDTLPRQQAMAAELDAALNPGEPVQAFDMLWFPVLSGRRNATPYAWTGGRINLAYRIYGVDPDRIAAEVQAARPTVLMIESSARLLPLDDWLESDYKRMGRFYAQSIYVLSDRGAIRRLVNTWPLS